MAIKTENFKVGDKVDYQDLDERKDVSNGHIIRAIDMNVNQGVAWITNKIGCVSLSSLTRHKD